MPGRMALLGCVVLLTTSLQNTSWPAGPNPPNPALYAPHIWGFSREEYHIKSGVHTRCWLDGRFSGIPYRLALSELPAQCWAIEYVYVWNDESRSEGHIRGTPDPEPIIVFVSFEGKVVGVQSRLHGDWLPINSRIAPWDLVNRTHLTIGFAANVHVPAAGLLHTLAMLSQGRLPEWLAYVYATHRLPDENWGRAAHKYLADLARGRLVVDGGHGYKLVNHGKKGKCSYIDDPRGQWLIDVATKATKQPRFFPP